MARTQENSGIGFRRHSTVVLRQAVSVGILILTILVPLCVLPFFLNYYIPKQVLLEVFAVLLAAIWVIGMAGKGEIRLIKSHLYFIFLAFLCICLLSLYPACNRPQGLRVTFQYACYFLVAILAFHTLQEPRQLRRLATVMALTGGTVAFIGFMQYVGTLRLYTLWNHPVSTIGNVTYLAAYYNVVLPISLALIFLCRSLWQRIVFSAACLLMVGHLMIAGSRGGWLGAAITAGVFVTAWLSREPRCVPRRLLIGLSSVVVLGLFTPFLSGLASSLSADHSRNFQHSVVGHWQRVIDRIDAGFRIVDHGSRQRVYLWEDTLRMALGHPVLGVGVGNFEYAIPLYASRETLELKRWMEQRKDDRLMAYRAHNEYLEVWAETGILGFGVLCLLLCQIAAWLCHLLRRYAQGEGDILTVGLTAAFAASLIHAFFCANLQSPASALHFWLAVGMIWSLKFGADREQWQSGLVRLRTKGAVAPIALCGALALFADVALGAGTLLGAHYHQQGLARYRQNRYEEARIALEQAVWYCPPQAFSVYHLLGLAFMEDEQWDQATTAFQESLLRHPNNAAARFDLGFSLGQAGRYEEAIAQFREAVRLDPGFPDYRLRLGEALGVSGAPEAAIDELHEAIHLTSDNAEMYQVLGVNYRRIGNLQASVAALREALALQPDDDGILNSLAVTLVQMGDFSAARPILLHLVERNPDRSDYRTNFAATLFGLGDLDAALHQCYQVLESEPNSTKACGLIRLIQHETGRFRGDSLYKKTPR